MRDNMKACQHTLSNDVEYKEVVVIGNGPSGMVTSYMLAGNVPYLKSVPEDLPIDEMLRARLSNIPEGQSLYEVDLFELAEGLEGRGHNPVPLLMDNLLRPCADLGIQADSLIEWKYDVEKQIDHIVLGRGPPGGAWHTFAARVRTLSPGAWLALPPLAAAGTGRLPARAVAAYCRRYVQQCKLTRYFRTGVVVCSVTRAGAGGCARSCPRRAAFCVSGYDMTEGRPFRYLCRRVVVACGAGDRPNALEPSIQRHALSDPAQLSRVIEALAATPESSAHRAVLVVGSGVSAADAVRAARAARLHTTHLHRAAPPALARLPHNTYPDYYEVYKMMCAGSSGDYPYYQSYPQHMIVDVAPLDGTGTEPDDLRPKKVTLLNVATKELTELTVRAIAVLIGSKPDLFFLQTNFNLNCIQTDDCKCEKKKIDEKQCFLRNHWVNFKNALEQSIQSCKSRYLSYTEINGNETKCDLADCKKDDCEIIPKCDCQPSNPYSGGIGFGVDPLKPVDGRSNPLAIDKGTHELLSAPGLHALGPVTGDGFVRYIPGGALAIVAHLHRTAKTDV